MSTTFTTEQAVTSVFCKGILAALHANDEGLNKPSNWKRVKKYRTPNYRNSVIRVFQADNGTCYMVTTENDNQTTFVKVGDETDGHIVVNLIEAAKDIDHCGDYGLLFWNKVEKKVWWTAGDGDGDEENGHTSIDSIITKFETIHGVADVCVEAECDPDSVDPENSDWVYLGRHGTAVGFSFS